MANNTYLWVGGAGSGMDRFDFNYPGNWLTVRVDFALMPNDPNREIYSPTTNIPGPGDIVWVGTHQTEILESYVANYPPPIGNQIEYRPYDPPRYEYTTKAPLLFGGFSGNENGGIWLDKNGQGVSGHTWTSSLSRFIFGVNARPDECWTGIPFQERTGYGFPVLGGGITLSTALALKDWYPALESSLENLTQRQKDGLKIKADFVRIDKQPLTVTDWASASIADPNYQINPNKLPPPAGLTGHIIELKLIKNYGYFQSLIGQTEETLNKWFRSVVTTVSGRIWQTNLKLVNSFIKDVNIISNGEHFSLNGSDTRTNESNLSGNNLEFNNCTLWTLKISGDTYYTLKTTSNTVFYNILTTINMKSRLSDATNQLSILPNSKIEGVGNALAAFRAIFPTTITGPAINTTPAYVTINYAEQTSSYCPNVILGAGLTGPVVNATGVLDSNKSSRWNLILEPGLFIPTLTIKSVYALAPRTNNPLFRNVNIGTVNVGSKAILDLHTNDRDVWKVGYVQGITLVGGINMDIGGSVIGSSKTRLLNYVVKNNINKRTGGIQPVNLNTPLNMAEEIDTEAR